jgi:hypothetical protein
VFEAFSFVAKAQCAEHGITGMRDTAVSAMVNPEIDESTGDAVGWMRDPYDHDKRCRDAPRCARC